MSEKGNEYITKKYNKFLNEKYGRIFTVNDTDVIQYCHKPNDRDIYRIVEEKSPSGDGRYFGFNQLKILRRQAEGFDLLNSFREDAYHEVLVMWATEPYEMARILNVSQNKIRIVSDGRLMDRFHKCEITWHSLEGKIEDFDETKYHRE